MVAPQDRHRHVTRNASPIDARLLPFVCLLLGACTGTGGPRPGSDVAAPPHSRAPEAGAPDASQDVSQDGAIAAQVEAHVVRARELFAAGDPGAALVEVDRALELAPQRPDLRLARADGLVVLGRDLASAGSDGLFVVATFEDALRAYDACEPAPRVELGRAYALTRIGRGSEAWVHAQAALALEAGVPGTSPLAPREEIVATAAYLAYGDAVLGAAPAGAVAPSIADAVDAVAQWIAVARDEVAAWTTLVDLYLFAAAVDAQGGHRERALTALVAALEHLPDEPRLVGRLVELAHAVGGPEEAAHRTRAYAERLADSASARFLAARSLFDLALARFAGPGAAPADVELCRARLAECEAWFARAGELDPDLHGSAALGWRAVARIAVGWVEFYAGDLAAAEAGFMSANEVFPRGVEWSIDGTLQSGVQGLFAIGSALRERGDLAGAARVASLLHALVPGDANFANNAGFLERDLAVELEARWRALAAKGDPGAPEVLDEAWLHMRASASAYTRAAELLPDDVRVVNDAALVFAYYLHERIDWAEETFRRAIALGEEQLRADDLSAEQRFELENAWGDAHENLGVLLLEHRGDADGARHWLERAVAIGPAPRPMVTEVWLARLDGRVPPGQDPYTILDWGRPRE
jgi:tetratricopeptide (TPR) repeat protein